MTPHYFWYFFFTLKKTIPEKSDPDNVKKKKNIRPGLTIFAPTFTRLKIIKNIKKGREQLIKTQAIYHWSR